MKFEGGWTTECYKRVCNRTEVPEGYLLFRSKDRHEVYCTNARLARIRCHQEMGDYYRDFKGGREQHYNKS
jgi:hypothetical protein